MIEKLILEAHGFRFLLVRNQDVPAYVLHQSADIGVVGLDVLEEKDEDLLRLLDLGIESKVCVGIQEGKSIDYTAPELKVATKMTHIAQKYFSKKRWQ